MDDKAIYALLTNRKVLHFQGAWALSKNEGIIY